jgi:RND family efflux transporter MFP subunit
MNARLRHHFTAVAMLVGGLALVTLAAGCRKPAAAALAPPTVDVVVATPITKRIVEWDEYTGRLEPIEFVEVRARGGGYLKEIHFVEGQIVAKGDLLCVIDARPYASAVRREEAAVREAQAKLGQAESELARSTAGKKEADSRHNLERQRYERAKKLVGGNTITQEEFDIRESSLAQAKALVESADAEIVTTQASIEVAAAAVDTAQAALNSAQIQLNYTNVVSPIGGRVSRRAVTEGNLISGGTAESTLLTTIVSLDPIHVTFDADEAAFLKYQRLAAEGTRASSRDAKNPVYLGLADEQPTFPHCGHMDFVDNRMDPSTGTMRGRAILRNADFMLTPGLFARVRLPGSGEYEAVLIPDGAVLSDQSEKFVYVVEADGTIRRQQVEIGGVNHGLRIVRKGLDGAEQIIVRGLQRVRPGLKAKTTVEQIAIKTDDGLPDHYQPVPESEWISRDVSYLPTSAPAKTASRPTRTASATLPTSTAAAP